MTGDEDRSKSTLTEITNDGQRGTPLRALSGDRDAQSKRKQRESCGRGTGASKDRGEPQKCGTEQERLAPFLGKLGEQEVARRSRR